MGASPPAALLQFSFELPAILQLGHLRWHTHPPQFHVQRAIGSLSAVVHPHRQATLWRTRFLAENCVTGTINPHNFASVSTQKSCFRRCLRIGFDPSLPADARHGDVSGMLFICHIMSYCDTFHLTVLIVGIWWLRLPDSRAATGDAVRCV